MIGNMLYLIQKRFHFFTRFYEKIKMLFNWQKLKARNYSINNRNLNTTTPTKNQNNNKQTYQLTTLNQNRGGVGGESFLLRLPYQKYCWIRNYACPFNLRLFTATVWLASGWYIEHTFIFESKRHDGSSRIILIHKLSIEGGIFY